MRGGITTKTYTNIEEDDIFKMLTSEVEIDVGFGLAFHVLGHDFVTPSVVLRNVGNLHGDVIFIPGLGYVDVNSGTGRQKRIAEEPRKRRLRISFHLTFEHNLFAAVLWGEFRREREFGRGLRHDGGFGGLRDYCRPANARTRI